MTSFFVHIYDFFRRHKGWLYSSLVVWVALMAFLASRITFQENISSFFPDTAGAERAVNVFDNLKVKDKIVVMLSSKQKNAYDGRLTTAADELAGDLQRTDKGKLVQSVFLKADGTVMNEAADYVYAHLPLFLTDRDYLRFDTLLTAGYIQEQMQRNYDNLLSPAGMVMQDFVMRDPVGLGGETLKHLRDFQLDAGYTLVNNYIYSKDGSTLLLFITPRYGSSDIGKNDVLVTMLENCLNKLREKYPQLQASYVGGPSVGVYNARQLQKDTYWTSALALVVIILFISLVFKRKSSIPLILVPVVFGVLFGLSGVSLFKGSISVIAVAAGSAVIGLALSYSIHMMAHQNHVKDVRQLLKDLVNPLTIGSFTTIGAFLGLLFTDSGILRDFGLFASLSLIGTTLFCLLYLPHFLHGLQDIKEGRVLRVIEKINAYSYDRNKWLVGGILLLTVVCFFFSFKVRFNNDMMALNYEPPHLKAAEARLMLLSGEQGHPVMIVSTGHTMQEAVSAYHTTNQKLAALKKQGLIQAYASAERFFVSPEVQKQRLERWNRYWTPQRKALLREHLQQAAAAYPFQANAFDGFYRWLDTPFRETDGAAGFLSDWVTEKGHFVMLISQIKLDKKDKPAVYAALEKTTKAVVFDRGFFANQWVSSINDNFNLVLFISSCLVFVTLLVSYGRIELTLISFLPMMVSWVIIIGLMGMFGLEFNIVNIILSTFIFGMGDDFSIFIMDGLLNKFRRGENRLDSHKTAIFFSTFTVLVGIGVLIFAGHPALQSLALISTFGMVSVVLVAYTLEPLLFRLLITNPVSKGNPPYTFFGLLRTAFWFFLFANGSLFLHSIQLLLDTIPVKRRYKAAIISFLMCHSCRLMIRMVLAVKKVKDNPSSERFREPVMIVANHQSYIDILFMLALTPKIVMMTNNWVWHSPVFGALIRYTGFIYAGDGYEKALVRLRQKVAEGYSVVVFPEGTRSVEGTMRRFHKGAFYLAEQLGLDIVPVLFYGHNRIIAKKQPFNIRKGLAYQKILPRIKQGNAAFGMGYRERTKRIEAYMKQEYAAICRRWGTPENPSFYDDLVENYIYKGPVVEWYIRTKVKMEHSYLFFDRLLPRDGQITDLGCGLGPLDYMLAMTAPQRSVLGVDYDWEKIEIASRGWLKPHNLQFVNANVLDYGIPESDVFILNDMLHYLSYDNQVVLLKRCSALLRSGGCMIVRDGDSSNGEKHKVTQLTEVLSTKVFHFNRMETPLCFTSEKQIRAMAAVCGLSVETVPNDRYTSNEIYIMKKRR